jgi:hypothetical protein
VTTATTPTTTAVASGSGRHLPATGRAIPVGTAAVLGAVGTAGLAASRAARPAVDDA